MTDAEKSTEVEKLPLSVQPWAHTFNFAIEKVHQVGTPGVLLVMLCLGAWYVYPQMVATQTEVSKLTAHQEKVAAEAMPLLKEATQTIPLLRKIAKEAEAGNAQRHDDLVNKKPE